MQNPTPNAFRDHQAKGKDNLLGNAQTDRVAAGDKGANQLTNGPKNVEEHKNGKPVLVY